MENTREYFDRVAVAFNRNYAERAEFRERTALWERLILAHLPRVTAGAICLDMGCGDGALGQVAAARGVRTIGIDQSESMLRLARQRAIEHELAQRTEYISSSLPLDAQLLGQYAGRVALILCSSVLEYIDPYEEVLRQFHQLLDEGGRLIVSVSNGQSLYRRGERLLGRFRGDTYLRHQRHVFCAADFRQLMGELGFAALHEEYFALPFHSVSSRLVGNRRGARLATLYALVAEKRLGTAGSNT